MTSSRPHRSLLAGTVAAVTASVCCVGPLVLLMLGVSGAWIGYLTAFEPYRPVFVGITLAFLGLAFRRLYLAPRVCAPGQVCATPAHLKKQRALFWTVSTLLVALLAFPAFVPLFID